MLASKTFEEQGKMSRRWKAETDPAAIIDILGSCGNLKVVAKRDH